MGTATSAVPFFCRVCAPDTAWHYFNRRGVYNYMVITKRFPSRYYSQIDFPFVMAVVVLFLFIMSLILPPPFHGSSLYIPKADNPVDLPSPEWRDLMMLGITRDGTMFFGQEKLAHPQALTSKIREHLRDKGGERRVYINADSRTRCGYLNEAIDAIRDAGIEDIAFLVEQRRPVSRR